MSLNSVATSDTLVAPDTAAQTAVESYLRACQVVDSNQLCELAQQIVQQASDACHSFASANAKQLCKLSLRLAAERMTESLRQGAAEVIPRETPTCMSPAAPVRMVAAMRFLDWYNALRPARSTTLAAKS